MKPNQTGRFRAIGADILRPKSMKDLLEDKAPEKESQAPQPAQMHTCTDAQGTTSAQTHDARLHVFIRGPLDDQIDDEVRKRKKLRKSGKSVNASRRGVVEDALEAYFSMKK